MSENVSKWLAQLPSCDLWFHISLSALLCLFATIVIVLLFAKRQVPMEQVHWYLAWIEFLRSYSVVVRIAAVIALLGSLTTIVAILYFKPCTKTPLSALLVMNVVPDSHNDTYKFSVWLRATGARSYTISSVTINPFQYLMSEFRPAMAVTWDAEYKFKYGLRPRKFPLEPYLSVDPDTKTDVSFEMVLEPNIVAEFESVIPILSYHTDDPKIQGTILLGEPMRPASILADLLSVPIRINFRRTRHNLFPLLLRSQEERLPETQSFSQLVSKSGIQMGLSESDDIPYLVYEEMPSLDELFEWNLDDDALSDSEIRSMIPNYRDRWILNHRIQQDDKIDDIISLFSPGESREAPTDNPFVYDICAAFPDERCKIVIVQGMQNGSSSARSSYVLRHLLFPTEIPTDGERQMLCEEADQFKLRSDNALAKKFCGH